MGFKPENAKDVFDNRYGDCKGMANLTKTMLKTLGFDAKLSWIGTTHLSKDLNYAFPSLLNDNHMICALLWKGDIVFFDPIEEFSSFGDYAERLQGRTAMVKSGDTYELMKMPKSDMKSNTSSVKTQISLNGDKIDSKSELAFNGESKTNLLRS